MRKIIKIIIFSLSLFLTACKAPINLNLGSMNTQISIEGYITTDTTFQWVKIFYTRDYLTEDNTFVPLTTAKVTIQEINNNQVLNQITLAYIPSVQYYVSTVPFNGKAGNTYQLQVFIGDTEIIGTDVMRPQVYLDSIKFQYALSRRQRSRLYSYQIVSWFQEPPTAGDAYIWDVFYKGKDLTDTLTNEDYIDDTRINGSYLTDFRITKSSLFNSTEPIVTSYNQSQPVVNSFLRQGDTVLVQTSRTNNAFYQYLSEISQSVAPATPFQGPPANPIGNLYLNGKLQNGVYGYFAAKSITRKSIVLDSLRVLPAP